MLRLDFQDFSNISSQEAAVIALGEMGPDARAAVPELVSVLRLSPWRGFAIRWHVVDTLGKIGPDAKPAILELAKILRNREEELGLRESAAEALGDIGCDTPDAVNALSDVARHGDTDQQFRKNLVAALRKINPKAAADLEVK